MKVLVINGSPRGEQSSTMHLTRAFLEGAGWQNAEIIDLTEQKIEHCMGCFACWFHTPGSCVINDSMSELLPKLIAADVVVWSFPLYYYNIPGKLKSFIDRNLPLVSPEMSEESEIGDHPDRYDLSSQRNILISGCGFWTAKGNYPSIEAMFDLIWAEGRYGDNKYEKIFVGQGSLLSLPTQKIPPEVLAVTPDAHEIQAKVAAYLDVVRTAGSQWADGKIDDATRRQLEQSIMTKEAYEKSANQNASQIQ
ncbi:MAG: flavodoxin family protein [Oscillospiraceae bacterium]|nr:flavodoxin family protein [Oscillospiraceae bacterium]